MKGGEKRHLIHMQFIQSPRHGTTCCPAAFLTYHREATKFYDIKRGPVVVHCSAGVGRTGMFLALDYLLKQAEQEGRISVYNCVTEMRTHRVGMIQNLDQYIFVYATLLEALHCGKVVHEIADYERWIKEPCSQEVQKQFMTLEKIRRAMRPEETSSGRLEENQMKNVNPQLLPLDKWRPLLVTPVPLSNDYINAVFVKSEIGGDGILVTQSPMKNTVTDIWRLVYDHECAVVVDLAVTEEFPEYFSTHSYGPFNVSLKSRSPRDSYVKTILTYSLQKLKKHEAVHLMARHDTPDESLPDIPTFLALVEATNSARQGDSTGRILVHCRNGLDKSGLFCALSLICQKIKDEKEVDVFHAVKQIRVSRPEFITSLEEYQWLHQAALYFIQSFHTYANLP